MATADDLKGAVASGSLAGVESALAAGVSPDAAYGEESITYSNNNTVAYSPGTTVLRRASSVFRLLIPRSNLSVNLSSFVSSVFCSGVIEAERRRCRAPEKLRLIAAIGYRARAATAYL